MPRIVAIIDRSVRWCSKSFTGGMGAAPIGVVPEKIDVKQYLKSF